MRLSVAAVLLAALRAAGSAAAADGGPDGRDSEAAAANLRQALEQGLFKSVPGLNIYTFDGWVDRECINV